MPELRIVGTPGTHKWRLIGKLYGREATIAEGSLFGMIDKRAKLERAET